LGGGGELGSELAAVGLADPKFGFGLESPCKPFDFLDRFRGFGVFETASKSLAEVCCCENCSVFEASFCLTVFRDFPEPAGLVAGNNFSLSHEN
jgi:hypothetical protein